MKILIGRTIVNRNNIIRCMAFELSQAPNKPQSHLSTYSYQNLDSSQNKGGAIWQRTNNPSDKKTLQQTM